MKFPTPPPPKEGKKPQNVPDSAPDPVAQCLCLCTEHHVGATAEDSTARRPSLGFRAPVTQWGLPKRLARSRRSSLSAFGLDLESSPYR